MNRKLKSSDEELDLLNKKCDEAQGKQYEGFSSSSEVFKFIPKREVLIMTAAVAVEVENLKAKLKKAK